MNIRLANLVAIDARLAHYEHRLNKSFDLGYIDAEEYQKEFTVLRTLQHLAARREARMRDAQFITPRHAKKAIIVTNYAGLYNFAPLSGVFIVDDFGNAQKLPDPDKYRQFFKHYSGAFYGTVTVKPRATVADVIIQEYKERRANGLI